MSDKWLHIIISAAIAVAVGAVGLLIGLGQWASLYAAALTSLGVGVGKEAADQFCGYNKWDWWDFAADVIGCVVGCLAVWMICLILTIM